MEESGLQHEFIEISRSDDKITRMINFGKNAVKRGGAIYMRQNLAVKVLVTFGALSVTILDVWIILHTKEIINSMVVASDTIYNYGFLGMVLMFLIIFIVAFPPIIGFNLVAVFCGMVYGMKGWPLLAMAVVAGCTAAFALFKYSLQDKALALVQSNDKFELFAEALSDKDATHFQNLGVLTLLRLSPLPYSLSNGAMAAVPGVSVGDFAISTALGTFKYSLQLFVGTQLKAMGTSDRSGGARILDFLSIVAAVGCFSTALYIIIQKMKAKMEQRTRQRAAQASAELTYYD